MRESDTLNFLFIFLFSMPRQRANTINTLPLSYYGTKNYLLSAMLAARI
uniref:Uncharacterized protein n=1 Tax=Siphoviridae sp. ctTIi48 TaxID=2827875 RepID=A0A8S5TM56_9CAUD|nr:MAG TPA: hypothetical protein [Siphoviridae sp. ctTIi48]DAI30573.1 MAG TPA: hypothetical protein [Caudoviricetes sp.]